MGDLSWLFSVELKRRDWISGYSDDWDDNDCLRDF